MWGSLFKIYQELQDSDSRPLNLAWARQSMGPMWLCRLPIFEANPTPSPLSFPHHPSLHPHQCSGIPRWPSVTPNLSPLPPFHPSAQWLLHNDICSWCPLLKAFGISSFPTELGTDSSGQHLRPWFPDLTPTHTSTGQILEADVLVTSSWLFSINLDLQALSLWNSTHQICVIQTLPQVKAYVFPGVFPGL